MPPQLLLDQTLAQKIIDYLVEQPYKEVAVLLQQISQLKLTESSSREQLSCLKADSIFLKGVKINNTITSITQILQTDY